MEITARIHHEDGQYWAEVDQLPGCFAAGATPEELIESLAEAISLYLTDTVDGARIEPVDTSEVGESEELTLAIA
jgi:predicted RNase H-like HicB family nuclease